MRVVIVEPEILIALDVESVLRSMDQSEMDIATVHGIDASAQAEGCDLLLCSVENPCEKKIKFLHLAAGRGAAIVVLTTSDEVMKAGLPWACISKPFRNSELVYAITNALRARSAG